MLCSLGVWVKSSVIVGCGAVVERVAMVEGYLDINGKRPEFEGLLMLEVVEPESSMLTAADVVLAMNVAGGGSRWLWFPS